MTPGMTDTPYREDELLPSINPTILSGKGPFIPVGTVIGGMSGVNIAEGVEVRSNPALPGVALRSSETGRRA